MSNPPILRVALPGPLRTLFDYLTPADCPTPLQPGIRLQVPFGRGSRCGILIQTATGSSLPADRLKPVAAILDQTPLLSTGDLAFLGWAADYYQHPLGDVIFHALPLRLRKGLPPRPDTRPGWRLTRAGRQIDPAQLHRARRQAAVLNTLREHPEGLEQALLNNRCGTDNNVLRSLQRRLWIESCELPTQVPATSEPQPPPPLSDAQQAAVERVGERLDGFQAFLLDGVTGSGKTEVYLNLIARVISHQRQALVLVPEIGLTPQLVRRFEQRLGLAVTLMHSNLAQGPREQAWLGARNGRARVLVGTRSAVFTPLPRLGLVIVDEEHDLSLKQQEGFRYSARDLAVVRARRGGCPILLGSATPSLESLHNARLGRYLHLQLPERAGNASLPRMDLIDIRSSRLDGGLSPALLKQIDACLNQGEQVMLFLNRRGFAPVVTCHACGWLADCPRCDARMTLHRADNLLWCHHCGHQQRLPPACPACGSPDLRPLGQGTERLECALQSRFPNIPLARIDRDTTRRKGDLERLLAEARSGRYPLLLGTQMLAKGHHFPHVTLVGLIDVDQGLFGADYRASERMAQLIIQVAGRAGRAHKPGRVLIQTRHPEHPLLFADAALQERRLAELPPFSYQVLLRAEANQAQAPLDFLKAAASSGQRLPQSKELEFWGPVPAPMERRAGRIRAHLLIQGRERGILQQWLSRWTPTLTALPEARKVRWSLDVDPQEMF
ncbi:MAG: primosomal protein N' [Chromatiales bacterium]|jgi:primosomal protein N' (replication factor Y)